MALSSSIYKVDVSLSNLDTHYYQDLNLTIARHPSETEGRMMYRLLAYLYCAHEDLEFTKGLGDVDEPALWQKNRMGEIVQWIDLGMPDFKRIRQSLGKSHYVKVFTYQNERALEWYDKIKGDLHGGDKLQVYHFKVLDDEPVERFIERSMKVSCIIEEGRIQFSNDQELIAIDVIDAK